MKRILFFFLINLLLAIDFQNDKYKLTLNSLFLFTGDYAQRKKDGKIFRSNSFYFPKVILDVVNEYQEVLFLKFYLDIADMNGKPSYELYAGIKPKKEMKIILGKFRQPLGYEVAIPLKESYFVEPSLIYYLRAPSIWDMGIGFFYNRTKWEININLVNGSGRTAFFDNNEWKDISGRMLIKPFNNLFFGTYFYYGKIGSGRIKDLLPFFRLSGELGYKNSSNIFIFEYLWGREEDMAKYWHEKQGFYFIIGRQIDNLQLLLRFDFKKERREVKGLGKEFGFNLGLNYLLKNGRLKITPNFSYYYYSKTHHLIKFILQFRAHI